MSTLTLSEKLLALHQSLDSAAVPHGFGGAIALAYCTGEPRGTVDIDLNVFLETSEAQRVFDSLTDALTIGDRDIGLATADGQIRLLWDSTPVDLFFSYHRFHADVAGRIRIVPFAGSHIPVLSCEDLLVFKAFFGRTQDWADIEAMVDTDAIDVTAVCRRLASLLGVGHPSYVRLLDVLDVS